MLKPTLLLTCLCVVQTCLAQDLAASNIIGYASQSAGLDVRSAEQASFTDAVSRDQNAMAQSLGDTFAGNWISHSDQGDKVFHNLAVTRVSPASDALAKQPFTNIILVTYSQHDMEMAAQAVGRAFKKIGTLSGYGIEFDIRNNRLVVGTHRMHFAALRKALSAQGIPLQLVHFQHQASANAVTLMPLLDLGIVSPAPLNDAAPPATEVAAPGEWLCQNRKALAAQQLSLQQQPISQPVSPKYVRFTGGRLCILQSTNKDQP